MDTMELLEIKKKLVVDDLGKMNVQAFVYQDGQKLDREIEVEPCPEEWAHELIFNEAHQNRFYVKDGVVLQYTEEELKAQPRHDEYLAETRKARYKTETDDQKERVIEILAKELEEKYPEIKAWLDAKELIRSDVQ